MGINTCALNNLDMHHCPEPPPYLSRPNNIATKTLIKNAMNAGHHLTVTEHIHLYIEMFQAYVGLSVTFRNLNSYKIHINNKCLKYDR